jgi:hypothetical protein
VLDDVRTVDEAAPAAVLVEDGVEKLAIPVSSSATTVAP